MKTVHEYFTNVRMEDSRFEYSWFHSWMVNQRELNRAMVRKLLSTPEYLLSTFAGVVARAVVEPSRDIESLRGRISPFEARSPRGGWRGCLRVCWQRVFPKNLG